MTSIKLRQISTSPSSSTLSLTIPRYECPQNVGLNWPNTSEYCYESKKLLTFIIQYLCCQTASILIPRGAGVPPFFLPCPFTFSSFALFSFSFFSFALPVIFFCPSLPFLPLCFQAGGRRRRPNLGLVCCVCFLLSVLIS